MTALIIGIILSAIGGFLISLYIKKEKHQGEHMVCPLGQGCGTLVNGRFAKFLGVPLENVGMVYYGVIALFYTAVLFREVSPTLMWLSLLLTGGAFAFSLYLTIIQLFVVKKWCTLCLGSGAISFLILVLSFIGFDAQFIEFIYTYRDLLKWIYVAAVLIGTLVTTLHTRTFVKFLRDFKITRVEERRLSMLSHTAWVALGFAILAGIALVLTDTWREITGGSPFIIMTIISGVLIVYEVVVNMIVGPKLIDIHFGDHPEIDDVMHARERKMITAFITTGVVSWYVLLALTTFTWFGVSTGVLFVGYIILLVVAVLIALRTEHILYKKSLLIETGDLEKTSE